MIERKLDNRPTWNFTNTNSIAGNYFPVNSAIAMRDTEQEIQVTLSNSRAQGGSSLKPGQMELMQNRRLSKVDTKGVGEPLDEVDAEGNGIKVADTYYLHIFN